MSIAERRLRQKEDIRSSILATAWQLVKQDGWQRLSIRKVADAIEYSIPVIYDHFENKEAILMEIGKNGFGLLVKKINRASKKSDDPAEQIALLADAYWDFAFKNKEYYQVMFGVGIASCDRDKRFPEVTMFWNIVMEPIQAILKKNNKPDANACLKCHTFWSLMHGFICFKMMRNVEFTDDLDKMAINDAIAGFIRNLYW